MELQLETKRLLLRRPRVSDLAPYERIRNSEYVLRYNAMDRVKKKKVADQLLEDSASDRVFFLEERSTGSLVGAVWLAEDDLRPKVKAVSLEYFLDERFAGQGLMTEALEALLPYAFFKLGAVVVSARVFVENRASQRVLEKLGFTREGRLRQAVRGYRDVVRDDLPFSLLREEFVRQRQESECKGDGIWTARRQPDGSMSF